MKGFTKCKNGHFYKEELAACPYCQVSSKQTEVTDSKKKTELYTQSNEEGKTKVVNPEIPQKQKLTRTRFGDDIPVQQDGSVFVERKYRDTRRFVGWLVTYSHDPMGEDFRIYEGRNIVGRDRECNITLPDPMMSERHALILYRDEEFTINDERSSHGTRVNNRSIKHGIVELHDGDTILMGETVFKFKIAL